MLRYALRLLGLAQAQVKQLLHVLRRGYLHRLHRDLEAQVRLGSGGEDAKTARFFSAGLYPSHIRLCRLGASQTGYSAVKESEAGRMSPEVLQAVAAEVEAVEALVRRVPVLHHADPSADRWLTSSAARSAVRERRVPCAGGGLSVMMSSAGVPTSEWEGAPVSPAPEKATNFLAVTPEAQQEARGGPSSTVTILSKALTMCRQLRRSLKGTKTMFQIACLLDDVVVTWLPAPLYSDLARREGPWAARDGREFATLLQLLVNCADEYTAVCLSTVSNAESHAARVVTHGLLAIAFYQCLRLCPSDAPKDAVVLSKMLRGYGLPTRTRSEPPQTFAEITASMALTRPAVAQARAAVCLYLSEMESATTETVFNMPPGNKAESFSELNEDDPTFEFIDRYIRECGIRGYDSRPPTADAYEDAQGGRGRRGGWSSSGLAKVENRALYLCLSIDEIPGDLRGSAPRTLLLLRDFVFRYQLGVGYVPPGSGGGEGCVPPERRELEWSFQCDDKKRKATVTVTLGGKERGVSRRRYPFTAADPRSYGLRDASGALIVRPASEDDVLHSKELPTFSSQLTEEDAEVLVSYMTAPYVSIPLILNFFARDRLGALFNVELQALLRLVLFAPGVYAPLTAGGAVRTAPCERHLLATDRGLLISELEAAPAASLGPLCALLHSAEDLLHGSYGSVYAQLLCYLTKLASHVLDYMRSPGLQCVEGEDLALHDRALEKWLLKVAVPRIDTWLDAAVAANDKQAAVRLHEHRAMVAWPCSTLDATSAGRLLASVAYCQIYSASGVGAADSPNEEEKADTSRAMSESDKLLAAQVSDAELELQKHGVVREAGSTAPTEGEAAGLQVSDQELFWLMQSKRRAFVAFLCDDSAKGRLDAEKTLGMAIRTVSEDPGVTWRMGTGGFADGPSTAEWAGDAGDRYLVKAYDESMQFVLRAQEFEICFKKSNIKPVPERLALHLDYQIKFGRTRPHSATTSSKEHVQRVLTLEGERRYLVSGWQALPTATDLLSLPGAPLLKKVGGAFEVAYGGQYFGGPGRVYAYGQQPPSDVAWLSDVLDPLLFAALTTEPKGGRGAQEWAEVPGLPETRAASLEWLLPSQRVPAETTQVVLLCLVASSLKDAHTRRWPDNTRPWWIEIRLSRVLHCLDAYVIDAHGRRAYPRHVYASDSRFSLCGLTSSLASRYYPPSQVAQYATASGESASLLQPPWGYHTQPSTCGCNVVIEEPPDVASRRLGRVLVPTSILTGLLPAALVEAFEFWQEQHGQGDMHGERASTSTDESFFVYSLRVTAVPGGEPTVVRTEKASKLRRILVNLTDFVPGSAAAEIVRLLTRIEQLSHILAWTEASADGASDDWARSPPVPVLVELPRLRARFEVRAEGDQYRLHSLDRAGRHVLPNQSEGTMRPSLLDGIHGLLCGGDSGARELMVANHNRVRPTFSFCPLSHFSVPLPNRRWEANCASRVYTFEVHASNSSFVFNSLGATLYFAFCKLLARCYEEAFSAIDACVTDMRLSPDEYEMLVRFNALPSPLP